MKNNYRSDALINILESASESLPYPIAGSCKKLLDLTDQTPEAIIEFISFDILHPVLQYISHIVLSDLVASGGTHDEIYYYIQNILSRPTEGQYVGFLRETATYYKNNNINSAVPELIKFITDGEVENKLLNDGKPLLGSMVEYRNLYAHTTNRNDEFTENVAVNVSRLARVLLENIGFLSEYVLTGEDRVPLMGWKAQQIKDQAHRLTVTCKNELSVRPLIIKLSGKELLLLENLDISSGKLTYRGNSSNFHANRKSSTNKDLVNELFEELKQLLQKVRSEHTLLPEPDWENFMERSKIVTQGTIAGYKETGKYDPNSFIDRENWNEDGYFERFLSSDKSLLALSAGRGSGKSSLAASLAIQSIKQGNCTLFLNGQRLSYANVKWSGLQIPEYFSDLLNFMRPLDKKSIKKLIKQGKRDAPGKKLLFIIDAIDEIDGLSNKWNRFRAMDLLLKWISEISATDVKIVLFFDAAVYLDFEYLRPSDLPANIMDISFSAENDQEGILPWAIDLKGFNENEAYQLYSYYQQNTNLGYAPEFTWETLKSTYENELKTLYANPLVFKAILKALNGKKKCQKRDVQSIIRNWVDGITGASRINSRGRLQKLSGFIRNANITKHERLLANILKVISLKGSPAFLVEDLNVKKKREQQLYDQIENPIRNQEFTELKEAGLLSEEVVEIRKKEKEIFSRRITFPDKIIVNTMENIHKKILRLNRYRTGLFMVIFLCFFAPLFLLGFVYGTVFHDFTRTLNPVFVLKTAWETIDIVIYAFLIFSIYLIAPSFIKTYKYQITADNFIISSFLKNYESEFMKLILKVGIIVVVFPFLVFIVFRQINILLILLLFSVLILISILYRLENIVRLVLKNSKARITKTSFRKYYDILTSKETLKLGRRSIILNCIIFTLFIIVGVLFMQIRYAPAEFNANSLELMILQNSSNIITSRLDMIQKPILIVIFTGIFVSFIFNIYNARNPISQRISLSMAKDPHVSRLSFKPNIIFLAILSVIFIPSAIFFLHKDDEKLNKYYEIRFDDNSLQPLAEKDTLTGEDLGLIYAYGKAGYAVDLTPFKGKAKFNLAEFGKLEMLNIYGNDIGSSKNNKIRTLRLYDPGSVLENHNFPYLTWLTIVGECDKLPGIRSAFPYLQQLWLTENTARQIAPQFSEPNKNLFLTAYTDHNGSLRDIDNLNINEFEQRLKKLYLSLDWFNEEFSKCIISGSRFSEHTSNLERIVRLWLHYDENPEAYLSKMRNLTWLNLSFNEKSYQNPSYWNAVSDAVKNDLLNLTTLELNRTVLDSRGSIIKMLDSLVLVAENAVDKPDLNISFKDITEDINRKYKTDFLYAYQIIDIHEDRLTLKYPEDGKELMTGDIIISRQRSINDIQYYLANQKYAGDYGFVLYRMEEPGLVTANRLIMQE